MCSISLILCLLRDRLRNLFIQNLVMKFGILFVAVLLPLSQPGAQGSFPTGYLSDNSDWWSSNEAKIPPTLYGTRQYRLPPASTIRILGITLGDNHVNEFPDVIAKLGKARVTSRGDGAASRDQICYSSLGGSEKVHLIFEKSEIFESFYLFSGGPDWTGSDRCVNSPFVSEKLGTANGIHLRQSRTEVEAMLGQPSAKGDKSTTYSFEGEQTISGEDFEKLHPGTPSLPKETLVFTIDIHIDARFENSKLTYLAVSRSEVN